MATVDEQGYLLAITIYGASRRVPDRLHRHQRRQPCHIELDPQHDTATVQLWSGATSNVYRDQVVMGGMPFLTCCTTRGNLLAGPTVHRAQQTLHAASSRRPRRHPRGSSSSVGKRAPAQTATTTSSTTVIAGTTRVVISTTSVVVFRHDAENGT